METRITSRSAKLEGESVARRFGRSRVSRRRALVLIVALILVWPPLAWLGAKWLVVESRPERADALVVLGGSSAYEERTGYAARLYGEGLAPVVLLTDDGQRGGWSQEQQRNPFFVERAAAALEAAGVPRENVETLAPQTSSTYEEARLLREYASERGLKSLLVVTSGYHSRRARWTFERVFEGSGVGVRVAAVGPGGQMPAPASWWLSVKGWRAVALEYVKLAYYRLRY
jgi:uncharacterized SAM-binding protein YcdF (DUF218 family)